MRRGAVALALVASLVAYGGQPDEATDAGLEAIQIDVPFTVNTENGTVYDFDGGTILTTDAFQKVDQEFVRLQRIEEAHDNEPSPLKWFAAGAIAGGVVVGGLIIGIVFGLRAVSK